MAPQTEFQKLVGLIRARDELAPLRHVPLEGLRQAVNDMVGARVPEGEIEVVAQDLRIAIEGWLPLRRALEGWSLGPPPPAQETAVEPPSSPPPRSRTQPAPPQPRPQPQARAQARPQPQPQVEPERETARADMPRIGLVAAACERPSVLSAAEPSAASPATAAWRWYLLLFWATFVGGAALALHAAGWSPATAMTTLGAALSDTVWRALSGDMLSFGAALATAGLLGVAVTNLWVLIKSSRFVGA